MLLRFSTICLFICLLISSCRDRGTKSLSLPSEEQLMIETDHPDFVGKMEKAHNKAALLKNGLICFNLDMTFGNRKTQMKIFTTPNSSAIRVDKNDGISTVMLNGEIYTDADSSSWMSERFGIYTYQYFFMAPYKFSDEGTVWEKLPDMEIEGELTNRAKLTFESGTGDAPDDWYIVHADPQTNRVEYIGYIVTAGGTSIEEAEKNAHAIKYSEHTLVKNIPFPMKWEFFNYDKEEGLGNKIGEGVVRNVEMMDLVDQFDIIQDGTYTKISS